MVQNNRGYASKIGTALAAYAARDMYRHGKRYLSTWSGGAKYGSRYKKSKKTQPTKLVVSPSALVSKRILTDTTHATRNGNVQYYEDLNNISQGTSLDDRDGQVINVRGVKVLFNIRNLTLDPLYYRWALVSYRRGSGALNIASDINESFFRGSINNRNVDWDAVINGRHKQMYGINTERFTVHKQGHMTLAPRITSDDYAGMSKGYCTVDEYIPVNKMFHYDGTAANQAEDILVFVYWATTWDNNTALPGTGQIETGASFVTYFQG